MADIVTIAARVGVKVELIDKILGEITGKREHLTCFKSSELAKKIEQLDRKREETVQRLGKN